MGRQHDAYDDDAELTKYIWRNFRQLFTELERLGEKAVAAEVKATASGGRMTQMLRERWRVQNDPRVVEALKDGPDVFRRRVRERVLSEQADQVMVNRCPTCERIVATPKAQQCLWCGHDWHSKEETGDDDR